MNHLSKRKDRLNKSQNLQSNFDIDKSNENYHKRIYF